MKKILVLFILALSITFANAQIGGETVMHSLNLAYHARSAALGNDVLTTKTDDIGLGIYNPAVYNISMDKQFGFHQGLLASGINFGMLNYAKKWNNQATVAANLRYVTYGIMERKNEAGVAEGKFYAGDFIVGVGYAKQLNERISVGFNTNLVYSQLDTYFSFGFVGDLGAIYEKKETGFSAAVVAKNVGYQFKAYQKGERAGLPAEFQLAVSQKLKHAPFRFTLLAHHLNTFDLTYNDPNAKPTIDALTGDTIPVPKAGIGEKIFRHFTYQVELMFSKNFHIRTAFDYHLRQEMKVEQRPGLAGFSFGIGLKFKRFSLDYALVTYSAAGFSNVISLNSNLYNWKK